MASFSEDLALRGLGSEEAIDVDARERVLKQIAKENIVRGGGVFVFTFAVTIGSLLLSFFHPGAGVLVLGGGIYGLARMITGCFQLRSVNRRFESFRR